MYLLEKSTLHFRDWNLHRSLFSPEGVVVLSVSTCADYVYMIQYTNTSIMYQLTPRFLLHPMCINDNEIDLVQNPAALVFTYSYWEVRSLVLDRTFQWCLVPIYCLPSSSSNEVRLAHPSKTTNQSWAVYILPNQTIDQSIELYQNN